MTEQTYHQSKGQLLTIDTIENLTRSQTKWVTIWKDGQEEYFNFEGTSSELLAHLQDLQPSDFLVEEPSPANSSYTITRRWKHDTSVARNKRKS